MPKSEVYKDRTITDKNEISEVIKDKAKDPNYLIFTSFKNENSNITDDMGAMISEEYGLLSGHSYAIKSYEPEARSVYITNPHDTKFITEVPMHIFLRYNEGIDVIQIREAR